MIVPLMQHDAVHTYHWMTSAPVPQRRRARPGHAGPGRRDGRRGRIRGPRRRRRRARGGGRVRALVRVRAGRRGRTSSGCAANVARAGVPRRRRPGRDRRDPRRRDPARRRAARDLAAVRARRAAAVAAAGPRAARSWRRCVAAALAGAIVGLAGGPLPPCELRQRPVSAGAWPQKLSTCWMPLGRFVYAHRVRQQAGHERDPLGGRARAPGGRVRALPGGELVARASSIAFHISAAAARRGCRRRSSAPRTCPSRASPRIVRRSLSM